MSFHLPHVYIIGDNHYLVIQNDMFLSQHDIFMKKYVKSKVNNYMLNTSLVAS